MSNDSPERRSFLENLKLEVEHKTGKTAVHRASVPAQSTRGSEIAVEEFVLDGSSECRAYAWIDNSETVVAWGPTINDVGAAVYAKYPKF